MNPYIIITLLLCFNMHAFGQTFYYIQTKIIDSDNTSEPGDRKGQFITFNSKGCYDSDKDGYTVNNGFLNYIKTENNIKVFSGSTYWGTGYYFVSTDLNRINVKLPTGTTLVYVKSNAPQTTTTSYYRKEKQEVSSNPTLYPNNNNAPSSSSSNNNKLIRKNCSFCNGTGKNPGKEYGADYSGGKIITIEYCSVCGRNEKKHYHNSCPSCGGKGYTESYNSH